MVVAWRCWCRLISPNEVFVTSTSTVVREEYTTLTRHSVSRRQNTEALVGESMEYTTPTRHSVSGWEMHISWSMFDAGKIYWGISSTSSSWQSTSDWGHYETSTRMDDVLPTTSTDEGTSYIVDDGGLDDEFNVDPSREPDLDGAKVALFSELEHVPTEPEDVEGGSDEEKKDP
ncbi:hypothetical protein J1N35_019167 [Gossypium stocksii]|uniref:Uncharacterized protein n=1 Tax=Gossypium stocksii TaxID=47602 RepID=A0A9D3VSG6_9ROSI|nr:hypothetical protein J1N35_019167 [Gossypium stocksii]